MVHGKILIVDNSDSTRHFMRFILSNSGFLVTPVTSAEKAFEEADEYPYDIVLTDLLTSDLEGLKLIKQLRGHRWYENKPLLVVSIKNDAELKQKGVEAGVTEWILKPISPNRFIARIKELCPDKDEFPDDYDSDDDD